MKALTKAHSFVQDGPWLRVALDHGFELALAVLEDDLGRVVMRRDGGFRLDRTWSIAPNRMEPPFAGRMRDDLSGFSLPPMRVEETRDGVTVRAGALVAQVTFSPFSIDWLRRGETEPFASDRKTQAYFAARKGHGFQHVMARDRRDIHIGLGDKSGAFDKTGRRLRIDAVDPCGYDAETSDPLYKMIPFYAVIGRNGSHGLYYDVMARADVDFGATIDNYHGLFRSIEALDGDLDYYVFAGPTLPDVVRRFSWLSGGQALPPRWSLGFGMTSMAIADAANADAQIADFLATCRRHDIPCESFHFGSGYCMHNGRRYAFCWNFDKFPDPKATMARIEAAGLMAVANLKPCLLDTHPRLQSVPQGGLVLETDSGGPAASQFWDGMGYHLDFTDEGGRQWWKQGLSSTLLSTGLAAIWNDNNEYEIWDEDAQCGGDGRPFAQSLARPAQALLMTKLAHDTQMEHAPLLRPYVISRAGCAGISRYGQTWSGDNATAWKTLRYNLAQGLTMSMSGLYNIGHDVGGFHGPAPDAELLTRFAEFCCLWPRFVMNSWNDDGSTTLPWSHDSALPHIRKAMQLRQRLMPLLYTLMWRAARFDEPVIRPLVYGFPDDAAVRTVDDVFCLGADVLVAPVLEQGAAHHRLYLPEHDGGWHDFYDGRHYAGGEWAEVAAPLGHLPVFVRAGAAVVTDDHGLVLLGFGGTVPETTHLFWHDDDRADWRSSHYGEWLLHIADGRVQAEHLAGDGKSLAITLRHLR